MKNQTGELSKEEVLRILGTTEEELLKKVQTMLEASDAEFAAMTSEHSDAMDEIEQQMMSPDEMIDTGARLYLSRPGN